MRLLFIGDVVGRAGRAAIAEHVPVLRRKLGLDFVVANGENAAGGFGITENIRRIFSTPGWIASLWAITPSINARRWISSTRSACAAAAQLSNGTPGRGSWPYETAKGERVLVMNVIGRVFMDAMDDPFAAVGMNRPPVRWVWPATPPFSTFTPKRRARNRPLRISPTEGVAGDRHAYPCPDRRLAHSSAWRGLPDRRRDDRRL